LTGIIKIKHVHVIVRNLTKTLALSVHRQDPRVLEDFISEVLFVFFTHDLEGAEVISEEIEEILLIELLDLVAVELRHYHYGVPRLDTQDPKRHHTFFRELEALGQMRVDVVRIHTVDVEALANKFIDCGV